MLDGEESTADIGVVSLFPEIKGKFPDRIRVGLVSDTGIGYQDVNGSEVVFSLGDAAFDGFLGGDVTADREDIW